jgi:hypothetical protein
VFTEDGSHYLAVASRSSEGLNSHDVKGVLPDFGLESNEVISPR